MGPPTWIGFLVIQATVTSALVQRIKAWMSWKCVYFYACFHQHTGSLSCLLYITDLTYLFIFWWVGYIILINSQISPFWGTMHKFGEHLSGVKRGSVYCCSFFLWKTLQYLYSIGWRQNKWWQFKQNFDSICSAQSEKITLKVILWIAEDMN